MVQRGALSLTPPCFENPVFSIDLTTFSFYKTEKLPLPFNKHYFYGLKYPHFFLWTPMADATTVYQSCGLD